MKIVALIKEIITLQIGNVHDPKKSTPHHVSDGIIKTKYDEKVKEDFTKLVLNAALIPTKGASWDQPVSIINIKNFDQPYVDDLTL
jgi:hypothetical protein